MHSRPTLPRTVVVLGLVSFLMDVSSEMIHALLPVFLVTVVGATPVALGIIEGVGEALALAVKFVSGAASDMLPRRKPLLVAGYGLAALTKPWFAMAGSTWSVAGARFTDRLGKGLRGAPRDALIADVTPAAQRGAAYGLRQSLDTAGALAGPLIAVALLAFVTSDPRVVFWAATVPATLCVGLLLFAVREPAVARDRRLPWRRSASLGGAFWRVALIGGVLQLARFSEAFVILRANDIEWPLVMVPLVLVLINLGYAITAYPAGLLSDRTGRTRLLVPGIVALVVADLVLALVPDSLGLVVGASLWGLHLGLTAGVLAAMVGDSAPAALRGMAFGVFNLVSGGALLVASVIAGALWHWVGPQATFLVGAMLAVCAAVLAWRWRGSGDGESGAFRR